MLALTKTDLLPADDLEPWLNDLLADFPPDLDIFPISAVARTNLDPLVRALWEHVDAARSARGFDPVDD